MVDRLIMVIRSTNRLDPEQRHHALDDEVPHHRAGGRHFEGFGRAGRSVAALLHAERDQRVAVRRTVAPS